MLAYVISGFSLLASSTMYFFAARGTHDRNTTALKSDTINVMFARLAVLESQNSDQEARIRFLEAENAELRARLKEANAL